MSSTLLPHSGVAQPAGSEFHRASVAVLAPLSAVRFCMVVPDDCAPAVRAHAVVPFTPKLQDTIAATNAAVNGGIKPAPGRAALGRLQAWTVSPADGNCNDYAITKRHHLLKAGLPAGALLLAMVRTSAGESHLVLVVRSGVGDLVLDNLTADILPWEQTGYRLIKRQSPAGPLSWVS